MKAVFRELALLGWGGGVLAVLGPTDTAVTAQTLTTAGTAVVSV
jgi:hypothetical protein